MSNSSKILIFIFLTLAISVGFTISYFSNAENGENNVFAIETLDSGYPVDFTPSIEGSVYICPNGASLEEVNPLCDGIIVLNVGENREGMLLTTTTYEDREYYLVLGFENGGGGEFGFIEKSIKDLNDYIQNLPDEAFKNNPQQRKNALKNKLEEVFLKIESKEYQEAINKLENDIREKAYDSVGEGLKNDWIISLEAQQEIYMMIDDLVVYLKNLL